MKSNTIFLIIVIIAAFRRNECHATYLTNASRIKTSNKPTIWTEEGIWGPMIEEWALNNGAQRQSRIMQIPISEEAYKIEARKETIPKESQISVPEEIVTNERPAISSKPAPRQVSETDLYLLGAIEKLVYKVDFIEKRLRRVEEMLYYVMAGNRVDVEPCPDNFTRAGQICYMFANMAREEYDWKMASKHCKKLGGVLAELETTEENQDVITHIQNEPTLKGKDFWIGGLNPGLLWIWSNTARPIVAPGSQTNKENPFGTIKGGEGRCLRLAYNPALRSYIYKGTNCSAGYSYICEAPENSSSNEIHRLGRSRNIFG